MVQVDCAWQEVATLGESPLWSVQEQCLYWVDIFPGVIYRYYPKTGLQQRFSLAQPVTSVGVCENKDQLIVTLLDAIAILSLKTGELETIAVPEKDNPENRFNDGKCDRTGRFWCGTINQVHSDHETGSLYRVDPDHTINWIAGHGRLFNGMGWSPDNKTMYVTETLRYSIFAYDFDLDSGEIENRRIFTHLEPFPTGGPDGLTVDSEGGVWSVHYGLGEIVRYDPEGKLERTIDLPIPRPTSCAFGGENLDILFVTSAREHMTEPELREFPLSGSLFAIQPGVKGIRETMYKG